MFNKLRKCLGCRGNANRFSTVEDCVNTCGGLSEPALSDTDHCLNVKCDAAEENVSHKSYYLNLKELNHNF